MSQEECPGPCGSDAVLPTMDALLADATLLRGISVALRPPAPDLSGRLLALSAGLPEEAAASFEHLASLVGPELEPHYHATLGPAGRCPTGESDFSQSAAISKGTLLGDVSAFYTAFGFDPVREVRDTPDHVAAELAFGAFLLTKTAYAVHAGEREHAEVAFAGWLGFRADHLDPWLGAFCDRLEEHAACEFYAAAAQLTRSALVGPDARAGAEEDEGDG